MKRQGKGKKKADGSSRLLISVGVVVGVALVVVVSILFFRKGSRGKENLSKAEPEKTVPLVQGKSEEQAKPEAAKKQEVESGWTKHQFTKFGCSVSFPADKLQLSFPDLPPGAEAAATDSSEDETYFVLIEGASKLEGNLEEHSRKVLDQAADNILRAAKNHQLIAERTHKPGVERSSVEFSFKYSDEGQPTEEQFRIVHVPKANMIVKMSYRTTSQINDRTSIQKFFDSLKTVSNDRK